MNFSIFWQNLQFFHIFWHLLPVFNLFESHGPKNLIRGWIISYWRISSCHGIGFNFWISQILAIFFDKTLFFWQNFFQVFENFCNFFQFFQLQGPGNLLWGLLIGHFIVASNSGMVFNILMSPILKFFDKICKFFKVS